MKASIYFSESNNEIILDMTILLEKILLTQNILPLEINNRIYILCENEDLMNNLDKSLWTTSQASFLPHAIYSEENYDKFPILLSIDCNIIKNVQILFLYGSNKYLQNAFNNLDNLIEYNKFNKLTNIICILYDANHKINELNFEKNDFNIDNVNNKFSEINMYYKKNKIWTKLQ